MMAVAKKPNGAYSGSAGGLDKKPGICIEVVPELTKAPDKPRLQVDKNNPDQSVAGLRDILAGTGELYERVRPVRLAFGKIHHGAFAQEVTPDALMLMTHQVCRPYVLKAKGDGTFQETDTHLPRWLAVMYLEWCGEWQLPPLNGIATAPMLQDDGTIKSAKGYDPASGMWCENVPDLTALVPEQPTKDDAASALHLIRNTFKTFCFADAEMIDDAGDVPVVDTSKSPGRDESSFLSALMTAACRPSLHFAPGVLLRAAPVSGAGSGKGLLARCMCIIAFGREPHAVTAGATAEELEKRIAAELIEGSPALFLENLNNTAFRWRNGPALSKPLARFGAMGGALARGWTLRLGGRPSTDEHQTESGEPAPSIDEGRP